MPLMQPGTVQSCCQGGMEGAATPAVCLEVKAAELLFLSISQFDLSHSMKIPGQGHPPHFGRGWAEVMYLGVTEEPVVFVIMTGKNASNKGLLGSCPPVITP